MGDTNRNRTAAGPAGGCEAATGRPRRPYRPPRLTVLGTLEELTATGAGSKWESHPVFPSSTPR